MFEDEKYKRIGESGLTTAQENFIALRKLAEENGFCLEASPMNGGFFRLSCRTQWTCRPVLGLKFDATLEDVQSYLYSIIASRRLHI